jgi:PAS domain S-box-containing protein
VWKDQAELYRADDRWVMDSGVPKLSYEEPQTTPDGKTIWLRTSKVPLYDASHQVIGILGLYQDITEQKQVELSLRESEEFLRESQAIANLGSYVLDIASGVWKSSGVLDRLLGVDAVYEHTLDKWLDLIHPDDRAMVELYWQQEVLAQGCAFDKEYRIIRHADQAVRWVHGLGKIELDAQGNPRKMQGTVQDISERKQAEEELRKYKERLEELVEERTSELARQAAFIQAVLENVSDGIVACNEKGVLTLFNRATRNMHGIRPSEVAPEEWPAYYSLYQADGLTPMKME